MTASINSGATKQRYAKYPKQRDSASLSGPQVSFPSACGVPKTQVKVSAGIAMPLLHIPFSSAISKYTPDYLATECEENCATVLNELGFSRSVLRQEMSSVTQELCLKVAVTKAASICFAILDYMKSSTTAECAAVEEAATALTSPRVYPVYTG